jgi:hypothetical protein
MVVVGEFSLEGLHGADEQSTPSYCRLERRRMTLSAEPGKKMGPFTEFTLTSHDPALNWEDLTWLKEVAGDVPIYMKGVSSIEVSESLVPDLTIRIFV